MRSTLRTLSLLVFALALSGRAEAQWTLNWSSPNISATAVAGWVAVQQTGDQWSYRYYTIDSTTFRIMSAPNSSTPQYTYTFTAAERLAGNYVYSLGTDLTGDGIVDFYVLGAYGTSTVYRQSFKIFNVVTGAVIFEKNDAANSYSYPSIWDVDGDGLYECTFSRSNYPGETIANYDIYETGIGASAAGRPAATPRLLNLKQNYPNPFNPSTRIEYELDKAGHVEIDVLNVMGQRVQTLINQSQPAGQYTADWNGDGVDGTLQASGPYYVQMRIGGQPVQTRQMLLVR
jgi:hypothetical protein